MDWFGLSIGDRSRTASDAEMPDLVPDLEVVAQMRQEEAEEAESYPRTGDWRAASPAPTPPPGPASASASARQCQRCKSRRRPGWLIYDNTFGVIPEEVRDRWTETEAEYSQQCAKSRKRRTIPPVRGCLDDSNMTMKDGEMSRCSSK